MNILNQRIRALENFISLQEFLTYQCSRPCNTKNYIRTHLIANPDSDTILDLGCGEGGSREFFAKLFPEVIWRGVDIADSPEVKNRTGSAVDIVTFDGINLPYEDGSFDVIYCNQVLEHVRNPDALVADALRVLKPGGFFVGSVSYLEPYHSHSIFNFTPYGIVSVFTEAGFKLNEIRQGEDALQLIIRQILNRSKLMRWLWNRNYLYFLIRVLSFIARLDSATQNFLMVQFAGHLVFSARRPVEPEQGTTSPRFLDEC